jgi:hypothetical protein
MGALWEVEEVLVMVRVPFVVSKEDCCFLHLSSRCPMMKEV